MLIENILTTWLDTVNGTMIW